MNPCSTRWLSITTAICTLMWMGCRGGSKDPKSMTAEELKQQLRTDVSLIPKLIATARTRGWEKECLDSIREAITPFQTHAASESQADALGVAAYLEGKYGGNAEKASTLAKESLRVHPNSFAHLAVGIVAQTKEDVPAAVAAFRAAADTPTPDVDLLGECWNRLGTILMVQKQYGLALVALQNAVSMRPNDAAAHMDTAECFMHNRLWPAAVSEYNTACHLAPDNTEFQAQRATGLAATARTDVEYIAAAAALDQVLSRSPDDLGSKLRLAGLHARFLRLEQARRLLESCLAASSDFSDGWYNLARINEKLGDKLSMQAAHSKFEELMAKKVFEAEGKRAGLRLSGNAR